MAWLFWALGRPILATFEAKLYLEEHSHGINITAVRELVFATPDCSAQISQQLCQRLDLVRHGQTRRGRAETEAGAETVARHVAPPSAVQEISTQAIFQDEKPVRVAFLLLAYKALPNLKQLLRRLKEPWHFFLIHLDKKASWRKEKELQQLLTEVEPRYEVMAERFDLRRGGASFLLVMLRALELLIAQDGWEYFINLNDNDYPITSNQALQSFLQLHLSDSFVHVGSPSMPRCEECDKIDDLVVAVECVLPRGSELHALLPSAEEMKHWFYFPTWAGPDLVGLWRPLVAELVYALHLPASPADLLLGQLRSAWGAQCMARHSSQMSASSNRSSLGTSSPDESHATRHAATPRAVRGVASGAWRGVVPSRPSDSCWLYCVVLLVSHVHKSPRSHSEPRSVSSWISENAGRLEQKSKAISKSRRFVSLTIISPSTDPHPQNTFPTQPAEAMPERYGGGLGSLGRYSRVLGTFHVWDVDRLDPGDALQSSGVPVQIYSPPLLRDARRNFSSLMKATQSSPSSHFARKFDAQRTWPLQRRLDVAALAEGPAQGVAGWDEALLLMLERSFQVEPGSTWRLEHTLLRQHLTSTKVRVSERLAAQVRFREGVEDQHVAMLRYVLAVRVGVGWNESSQSFSGPVSILPTGPGDVTAVIYLSAPPRDPRSSMGPLQITWQGPNSRMSRQHMPRGRRLSVLGPHVREAGAWRLTVSWTAPDVHEHFHATFPPERPTPRLTSVASVPTQSSLSFTRPFVVYEDADDLMKRCNESCLRMYWQVELSKMRGRLWGRSSLGQEFDDF
ncbi:unnamed protein product [Durusdinium trenchii]|uniref:protein xylosyltransferase n=1 Tax=Durusdinium trenchii TaxID=1381693 RepID=A0ABP0RX94_9DINO